MGTFSMTIDHIQLTNKGTSDIFLDRVEFIPAASDTAQTGTFIAKEVTISNNQQSISIYEGETVYNTIELVYSLPGSNAFPVEFQFYYKGLLVDTVTPTANTPVTKQVLRIFDRVDIHSTTDLSGTNVVDVVAKLTLDSSLPFLILIKYNYPDPSMPLEVTWFGANQTIWGEHSQIAPFNKPVTSIAGYLTLSRDSSSTEWSLVAVDTDDQEHTIADQTTDTLNVFGEYTRIDINISNMNVKTLLIRTSEFIFLNDGQLTMDINTAPHSDSIKLNSQEDVNKITTSVNNLFLSGTSSLSHYVSDYQIDQVVLKVDALSDDVFGKEKKELRKLVNKAKQLSKARNLLIGGSFDTLDAWKLGKKVIRREDGDLFKGEHLLLPPPTTLSPSYAYQKIDEAKLKPYTRYTVSGFVAQGDPLEVVVSRYGKEVEKNLHVPYEEAHPITSEPTPNCCQPGTPSSCNGETTDSHFFHYSIDVGALQPEANLGISLGLRIGETAENTLGLARIGNLEIREERPLTASEIRKVQKVETKWKKEWEQER
ncbi:TPA: hypothetical protein QC311_005704, partial [Bacillus cereus]|nr:hypothetical protein [Bacillus cereus]HDR8464694.1 hypothetical protein [Bacillus cereus]